MAQSDLERRLELVLIDLGKAEEAAEDAAIQANRAQDFVSAAYATVEDILAEVHDQEERAN